MKLKYVKPMLTIEEFELASSIASNCGTVVSMGPQTDEHDACEDYYEDAGLPMPAAAYRTRHNIDFYEDCDCYYSASGTYFTS